MSGAHEFLEDDVPRDRQPGFWPEYVEPTPLARAMQMPLADPHWQNRVLNAYVSRGRQTPGLARATTGTGKVSTTG